MPFYRRDNGIHSLGEQFALKKNQAFQAHYDDTMEAMTRGYNNRRDFLQQEIKSIYKEMKDIKVSTGYSLDQVRSARPNGPARNPNTPTIYMPPIGIRLMEKFGGIDVRRESLTDQFKTIQSKAGNFIDNGREIKPILVNTGYTTGKRNGVVRLEKTRRERKERNFINVTASDDYQDTAQSNNDTTTAVIDGDTDHDGSETKMKIHENEHDTTSARQTETELKTEEAKVGALNELPDEIANEKELSGSLVKEYSEIMSADPLFCLARERHFTRDSINVDSNDQTNEQVSNTSMSQEDNTVVNIGQDCEKVSQEEVTDMSESRQNTAVTIETEDGLVIEKRYNLAVRRSSRSTFRTRSSVRLERHSDSHLSDHNKEMIGLSGSKKKMKSTSIGAVKDLPEKFYLDYGDGTLHDTMSIPKFKDCARRMCKPHCMSCLRRTTGKPCFVLIPATQNYRKRLIQIDKRTQTFPMYQGVHTSVESNTNAEGDGKTEPSPEQEADEPKSNNTDDVIENENKEQETDVDVAGDDYKESCKNIDQILKERSEQRKKKGYNKRRLDELSMPRGGPTAEVRFSKMTLRKKQNQLIEEEKRKAALSVYEKQNLELIQGKISVFLALLSQREYSTSPRQMVHLPIPVDVMQEKLHGQTGIQQQGKKRVNFRLTSRPRMMH